jgi:hypothetical protein
MPSNHEERFHAHLDVCQRCREEIFNLCPVGERLLSDAANDGELMFRRILQWNTVLKDMEENPHD